MLQNQIQTQKINTNSEEIYNGIINSNKISIQAELKNIRGTLKHEKEKLYFNKELLNSSNVKIQNQNELILKLDYRVEELNKVINDKSRNRESDIFSNKQVAVIKYDGDVMIKYNLYLESRNRYKRS
jgi:hypothetical protein